MGLLLQLNMQFYRLPPIHVSLSPRNFYGREFFFVSSPLLLINYEWRKLSESTLQLILTSHVINFHVVNRKIFYSRPSNRDEAIESDSPQFSSIATTPDIINYESQYQSSSDT